ncbi:proline dehydrogenase family protein [Streptomyces nitrosporeus]|uniref:proline dehydrogenase family protein n=1 Tax=Streptomyces nitrosporeus TaxID=28894 RepID=UPI0033264D9B
MTTIEDRAGLTGPAVAEALRQFARSPEYRASFNSSELLRSALWPAARRYILAEDLAGLLDRLPVLIARGYRIAVEIVGEEARTEQEVDAVVAGYLAAIPACASLGTPAQLGFDLSNIGSLLSWDLARENTEKILAEARRHGNEVVLSMEDSESLPHILDVFESLSPSYPNLGVTLQAYLHRTDEDLRRIAASGAKVRLVKGVYQEPSSRALARGPELDRRYIDLLERLVEAGVRTSLASHDPEIHALAADRGLLSLVEEVEMLHGVRPDLLRGLREDGVPCRVYCVYGRNWWLHVLHRLAEHPSNALVSIADLGDPGRVVFAADY